MIVTSRNARNSIVNNLVIGLTFFAVCGVATSSSLAFDPPDNPRAKAGLTGRLANDPNLN